MNKQHAPHPVTEEQAAARAENWQLRLADRITSFAGSMTFVWIHLVIFALWIVLLGDWVFNTDPYPFGLLTMIVSLEAILLSTFVMIGQNRQAEFQQRKAAHDFEEQELELKTNTGLTKEVHKLAEEIHQRVVKEQKRAGW